jgi:ABC-2 type transport system permease protein
MSLSLIIKREFNAKVRNKSFIVMTFLSPLLFVGMAALIGYLASVNSDEAVKIAIYDKAAMLKNDFKSDKETKYEDLSALPLAVAKEKASEDYEGLIYIPQVDDPQQLLHKVEYISNDSPGMDFINDMERVLNDKLTRLNLEKANIDYAKIEAAKTKADIRLSKFSGEESLRWLNEIKIGIGFAFGYLIMMFIIIYGNMVMRSVIEEKTNRIIEIIISSVKPFQLMMGKIIGTSLAGILQFLIWAILGTILFAVAGSLLGLELGNPAMQQGTAALEASNSSFDMLKTYFYEIWNTVPVATLIISFLLYFVGGFYLYSSIYAAIGAAVDSETDSQQFLLPIILPLMLGVYVGFFTVVNDPHGTVATIFSMIPLTSPIVMLMRIPFGVPPWEIIVSMLILFATFFLVVWFASKIYRIGILMYGKKPTYKELYKWLKY